VSIAERGSPPTRISWRSSNKGERFVMSTARNAQVLKDRNRMVIIGTMKLPRGRRMHWKLGSLPMWLPVGANLGQWGWTRADIVRVPLGSMNAKLVLGIETAFDGVFGAKHGVVAEVTPLSECEGG
jgi:hypothetical protein